MVAASLPPSSFVQTKREWGVTSRYVPKKSILWEPALNVSLYVPPVRMSIWQLTSVMGADFGTHHCLKSLGLVQASNTRSDGPLMVRDTTSSRSDFRTAFVWFFICFPSSVSTL